MTTPPALPPLGKQSPASTLLASTERTLRSRPGTKKPESPSKPSVTPAQKARLQFAAKVGKKLGSFAGRLVRKNMKIFLGLLALVALMFFGVIRFGVGGSTISLHLPHVSMQAPTSHVATPKKDAVVASPAPQKTDDITRPCAVPQKPKKSAPVLRKAVHQELPGVAVSNNEGWRVHPTEPRSLLSPALCAVQSIQDFSPERLHLPCSVSSSLVSSLSLQSLSLVRRWPETSEGLRSGTKLWVRSSSTTSPSPSKGAIPPQSGFVATVMGTSIATSATKTTTWRTRMWTTPTRAFFVSLLVAPEISPSGFGTTDGSRLWSTSGPTEFDQKPGSPKGGRVSSYSGPADSKTESLESPVVFGVEERMQSPRTPKTKNMTEQTNEDFSRALARSMVEQRVDNGRVYENMAKASTAFKREVEIARVRRIMSPETLQEMVKKDRKKYNLKKVLQ